MSLTNLKITGTGHVLGTEIVTNTELAERFGVSEDWIYSRTGIRARRKAADGETSVELAAAAARQALEMAGIGPSELDLIICCAMFPEHPLPSTACFIQSRLGAARAAAFDLTAACSGFLFGLETARNFALSGNYQNILVVGVDLMTKFTNPDDCHTSIIFGDGAGAVVLAACRPTAGIVSGKIYSDGRNAGLITVEAGGTKSPARCESVREKRHFMVMRGREIFKLAVTAMSESCLETLRSADVSLDRIKMLIPHQANQRIIDAVANRLGLPPQKVLSNIEFLGNTGSATIPIALDQCCRKEVFETGDLILLTSFGSGTMWASHLLQW